jgi:hypothetical protein
MPLSNLLPRGFGFVHHSIAILDHQVPNLSITIRNFFIAVWRGRRSHAGCAFELRVEGAWWASLPPPEW